MKTAIVVSEINIRGGTHKQVLRLCEFLEKQGVEFSLLTKYYQPQKTYPEFQKHNVLFVKEQEEEWNTEYSFFKKLRILYDKMWGEEYALFRKLPKGTTVVNIHDNRLFIFSFLVKMFTKAKLVWQINDLPHRLLHGPDKEDTAGLFTKWEDFFVKQSVKRADAITVNVSKNRTRVQEKMGRDAQVFYCGVDVNDNLYPHTYAMAENKPIRLLSAGVFFPYRNYETLVLVVEQLRSQGHNVHLDIIGSTEMDKPYADSVCALIREKGLQNEVTVWGQVDEETYARLYNEADMFLFLNIDQSWGLAVFEAMSCGLPVLVSNSVGAIELLHHDEDAVILEPKDVDAISNTIMKLASDSAYYNTLSQNAIAAVKEFTWDKLYNENMLRLFEQISR